MTILTGCYEKMPVLAIVQSRHLFFSFHDIMAAIPSGPDYQDKKRGHPVSRMPSALYGTSYGRFRTASAALQEEIAGKEIKTAHHLCRACRI